MTMNNDLQEKKDYLVTQENFERLIAVQRTIELATEMRPTFKKLINNLITDEALTDLTERLIKQMT
ncbi:MAG: hypothetical protein H0U57_06695 [Tatlockia sp.]|nr:hypothetical protein [Tatlockia sp.]